MGDDERPGTNNRVVLTPDGVRTFNKDKCVSWREVEVDLSNVDTETLVALAGLEGPNVSATDAKVVIEGMGKVVLISGTRRSARIDP
jgi:hypothetical protein